MAASKASGPKKSSIGSAGVRGKQNLSFDVRANLNTAVVKKSSRPTSSKYKVVKQP